MSELRMAVVRVSVDESEALLVAELQRSRDFLHLSADGRWSIAQIVQHLVRTEQLMFIAWLIVPKLARWPRVIRTLDRANALLWRAMGMRTISGGKLLSSAPEYGTYAAPVFLRPRPSNRSLESLIAWRGSVRQRNWSTLSRLDDSTLNRLRWSHPLFGEYTLLELVQFLGTHERHHLPQITKIREAAVIQTTPLP